MSNLNIFLITWIVSSLMLIVFLFMVGEEQTRLARDLVHMLLMFLATALLHAEQKRKEPW